MCLKGTWKLDIIILTNHHTFNPLADERDFADILPQVKLPPKINFKTCFKENQE